MHPTDVLVGVQDNGHNDTTNQFIAFKNYPRECIQQDGQLPFWNPFSLLGLPWLGNPQSSLFYPGNWIFLVTNALTSISWIMVLHHWWAGWGAYLLGRKYQLNYFSALLAGIIFLAAPYYIAKTGEGHFTSITQIAWFPWILYGYELLRAGSRKAVPLLAILIACAFFSGHVQELYYLLLFLTAALLIESLIAVLSNKSKPTDDQPQHLEPNLAASPGAGLKGWLLTGLLTAGLVAIDLVPVFYYTKQAVRSSGVDLAALRAGSLNLNSLWQLLDPFVWGKPDQYRGPGGYYWEAICSFGCLPLLLAMLGVLTSFRQRTVIRLTLIGLVAFLLAFGPHLPLYTACYQLIPGFSMFRMPARLLWICSLVIAMLAGFGCESIYTLYQNPARKKYRLSCGIVFCLAAIGFGYLMYRSHGSLTLPGDMLASAARIQMAFSLVALLGLCAAIGLATVSRKAALAGTILLCTICTWELAGYSDAILRTIPTASFRGKTEITRFLKTHLGEQRVLVDQKLLSDREAWHNQILKIQGYEPVPLVRLGLLAAATFPQSDAPLMMAGYSEPQLKTARQPLLNLMGVKYAILQTDQPVKLEGWQTVAQGSVPAEFHLRGEASSEIPYVILKNRNPLPRAFIVGQARPLNQNQPSRKIVSAIADLQPKQEVLLPQDLLPQGERQAYTAAEIQQATPNALTIQAQLDSPGYLIISDIYYPGWTAQLGEQELPVLPANFSLRAIPLPAGQHQVQLSYIPPGFKLGRIISVTALAILLILLVNAFRTTVKTKAD